MDNKLISDTVLDSTAKLVSTPSVTNTELVDTSNKFYTWLSSFWRHIYESSELPLGVSQSRGLELSQLYLNALETLKLQDRNNLPVFHREQWFPIVVKQSECNKSKISLTALNNKNSDFNAVIGKQASDSVFSNSDLKIGEHNQFKHTVSFPIPKDVKNILTCIVDNIIDPKIILLKDVDFIIENESIILNDKYNPFTNTDFASKFVDNEHEAILWGCNTLVDKDFVKYHLGYMLGIESISTQLYKNAINAVIDLLNNGCSVSLFNKLIASLCDIPHIIEPSEVVVFKASTSEVGNLIITSHNTYNVPSYMELPDYVKTGETLQGGTLLSTAIKVYPFLCNIDRFLAQSNSTMEKLMEDIPVLSIRDTMLRCGAGDGFSLTWDEVPILLNNLDEMKTNPNAYPEFYFTLEGDLEDISVFWKDVWSSSRKSNISLAHCLKDYFDSDINYPDIDYSDKTEDSIYGHISPMRFFLENLIGANTVIVTVDIDQLSEDCLLYDSRFFSYLRALVPSNIRLFFIEHQSVSDVYDLDDDPDDLDTKHATYNEDTTDYAYLDGESEYSYNDRYSFETDSYRDDVIAKRWIPACKDQFDQ
jgi:hypothetical protein